MHNFFDDLKFERGQLKEVLDPAAEFEHLVQLLHGCAFAEAFLHLERCRCMQSLQILNKCCEMNICLLRSASTQPRKSPPKSTSSGVPRSSFFLFFISFLSSSSSSPTPPNSRSSRLIPVLIPAADFEHRVSSCDLMKCL